MKTKIWKNLKTVNIIKKFQSGHQPRFPFFEDPNRFLCDKPSDSVLKLECEHISREKV